MELKIKYEKNGKKPRCPRTYRNTRLNKIIPRRTFFIFKFGDQ
jgi:hypothetical protein